MDAVLFFFFFFWMLCSLYLPQEKWEKPKSTLESFLFSMFDMFVGRLTRMFLLHWAVNITVTKFSVALDYSSHWYTAALLHEEMLKRKGKKMEEKQQLTSESLHYILQPYRSIRCHLWPSLDID